jgi:branched-chain amino acid transport system substrate-binding protein
MNKILLFLLFITFSLLPDQISADIKEIPSIGFVLPLSGDWAFLGNGIRDGAFLAQEDLRSSGKNVELIFEDNLGELSTSAIIGTKFADSRKVHALISIISGVGRVLKPLATRAKIINIGICSETDIADGEYNFINYLTAEQGVSKFLKQLGAEKSIGIFSLNESGFQKMIDVLKIQSANSLRVQFEDYFDRGTTDFRAILNKRKVALTDAWLILGLSPEIETLVKQARALGIRTPVVSIEGFGLARDKSPFEGAWFIDSAVPKVEMRARFIKKFGYEPTPGVGHSYDSVMMLAEALNKASDPKGEISRELAAQNFRQIKDYAGVIGVLSVKRSGVIWSEASVKVIKNSKPEIME